MSSATNMRRRLSLAQRWLDVEPWDENAHRQLMRALALNGQRNLALAQYETCRCLLQEELGVEPGVETTTLYEQLRDGADVQGPVPTRLHNLDAPLGPLLRREDELAAIAERLVDPGCRLLTLVGPGGIGKTRLAQEAAAGQLKTLSMASTLYGWPPCLRFRPLCPQLPRPWALLSAPRQILGSS